MRPARTEGQPEDPAVVALRKKARGEALTEAERTLLAARSVAAQHGTPHDDVMRELEERRRREQSAPRPK